MSFNKLLVILGIACLGSTMCSMYCSMKRRRREEIFDEEALERAENEGMVSSSS